MAPQGGIEFIDITINKGQRVGKNGGGSSSLMVRSILPLGS
jgi:hypothetical protein